MLTLSIGILSKLQLELRYLQRSLLKRSYTSYQHNKKGVYLKVRLSRMK